MNLSGISSIIGVATQLFGGNANPLGALGSLASEALDGARGQPESGSDPFSAILSLTRQADGLAGSEGLGGIAGLLA